MSHYSLMVKISDAFRNLYSADVDVLVESLMAPYQGAVAKTTNAKGCAKKYLKFYGMSSSEAMNKHSGGVASYRAAEGEVKKVLYKGPVEDVVHQILGGLRSACAYVGASKLKDLSKRTTFVRVSKIK